MDDDALRSVREHLQAHPHPHLTPNEVASNATVIDDSQRPDAIVFDVEKRSNAFGARYREDRPLSAYETYWERYSYNPQTEELRRLGINVGDEQHSTVTIHSFSRLVKDHLTRVLGLLDRAWP